MKHLKCVIILGITVTFLSGCASIHTNKNNDNTHSESVYVEETNNSIESEPEQQTENDIFKDLGNHLEGLIEDQTFKVDLEDWGEVTFASFQPEETVEMNGDVRFRLFKDGEEVYKFSGLNEDNTHYNQQFGEVEAIAFKDYNDDGLTDVIIISAYASINGPNIDEGYSEARIYLRKEDAYEFYRDDFLEEYLAKQRLSDSIASIMNSKEDYKEYVASFQ